MQEYNFDALLIHLGEFGRYQHRVYFLVCLMALVVTWHNLVQIFLSGSTDHWCTVPEIHNSDCAIWNLTETECKEVTKEIGIPVIVDGDSGLEYAQCERYNLTGVVVYPGINLGSCNETISCNAGWEYDTSQYKTTIISDFNLVCDKGSLSNLAQSIYFAGILFGDIIFGAVADRVGRRHTLLIALVIQLTAGIATVFSSSYAMFVALRFLIACCVGGVLILSLVIGTEFVGPSKRIVVCVWNYVFSTAGSMSLALLAFLIRKWRILQLVVSAPILLLCSFMFFIPESARWLLSKGRLQEADEIIRCVAKVNRVSVPESLLDACKEINEDEKPKPQEEELRTVQSSSVNLFLYPNLRRRLFILMWISFVNNMVYYGLSLNSVTFGFNEYLDFFLVASADLIGIAIFAYTVERWGRVITVCVAMVIGGSLCIGTGFMDPGTAKVIVASLGKVGISTSFAISLFLPIEIFPTPVRSMCTGIVGMSGGIGSIISPLLLIFSEYWLPLPMLVFGTCSVSAGFLALFLPETMGQNLPETLAEAETIGTRKLTTECRGYGSLLDSCRSRDEEER